jgi:hypothetical protein
MSAANETSQSNRQGPIQRTRNAGAKAIDEALINIAQILNEAAAGLENTISDDGSSPSGFARFASRKLYDSAQYIRNRKGNDLVDASVEIARRHPRLFVSGAAAIAGIFAYWLVSGDRLDEKRQ